jgi:hypothetical protein
LKSWPLLLWLPLLACSGHNLAGPSLIASSLPSQNFSQVPPPSIMQGYFVSGSGAPTAITPGSVSIVVPSWSDSADAIAAALQTKKAWAIVAVADQRPSGGDWAHTRSWMAPIKRTGRLAGVYVADEPFLNGWTQAQVESAVAQVKADGYKTMIAEDSTYYHGWRPPITWFGITAYYDPLLWTLQKYQTDPNLDVVFGPANAKAKWQDFAGWVGKSLFLWSWDIS